MGRADGVSDPELEALAEPEASSRFSQRERAALAYAEAITLDGAVSDELFERLRNHFDEDALVELTAAVAWEICAAKFNRALGIEAPSDLP